MNKLGKIILYAVGILAVYILAATLFNAPVLAGGSLIFLLLLACPLMFLFMDHGGQKDEKKTGSAHQHYFFGLI